MENVLLDQSPAGFDVHKTIVGGCGRFAIRSWNLRNTYNSCPYSSTSNMVSQLPNGFNNGIWNSPALTPRLPYARPSIYSSPSLPLQPFNQPPLLPLPPPKYCTYPYPCPPPSNKGKATTASRQRDQGKKPRTPRREPPQVQKKKPLERAPPLPPAPVVIEALDDLEQEVARTFVVDLLHALAPPPSSLPLPKFPLVKSTKTATAVSCNAEALGGIGGNGSTPDAGAATDGLRRLLRL